MAALLPVEEALALVLARAEPLPAETVSLEQATGRVLAASPPARTALPPFPSSAMDGFAVRSAECPGTLAVEVRIPAGRPAGRALRQGEAMGIATGAVVPDGADAVVPLEDVVDKEDNVEIPHRVPVADNIRPRGGDVEAGAGVLPAGARLGPAQLAALAAAGVETLSCARRPRVAVLVTGTELRAPGAPLAPGEIYESNGAMLAALLDGAGAAVERLAPVEDDEDAHREAIRHALEADVVVSTGGVSVGPHDLVRRIEAELGVEEVFWGVAMRPGKPLAFGMRDRTLVFGLPGNPVSSLVGGLLFICPAILALQGAASPAPRWQRGELGAPARRSPSRDDFARAVRRETPDQTVLTPIAGQESHMIVRAAAADSLVHVPRGEGELAAGAAVRYLPLEHPGC